MTKYSVMNDETLVEICLLGESGAFEELVLRHENAVMSAARHVTGSRFTAEDASQDAFLSAWMCLDSLRDRSKFKPWVCAIAKNCAMALVTRYRSVVPDISLHLVENKELSDNPDPELSALLSSETDEELHALVDALSEKLRETIRLHYFEGYSVNEIAERLSVPVGTVKWRLAQGRKQLRKGYGIMEKEYDENEALVSRVMQQVEELKLWQLRRDKTGFGEAYENVLAAVESLEESKEKQHMLADVWLRKAWWLEDSEELREKIKEAALAGHNEDVMQAVVSHEHNKLKGEEKIHFMRETQIPELEAAGFREALAYVWFWLGREYLEAKHADEGFDALNRVLDLLNPTDVYYANALSAIWAEKKLAEAEAAGETSIEIRAMGETYRKIDGNWVFWNEPGYARGTKYIWELLIAPMYHLSLCDDLLADPTMKPGDQRISSDRKTTLTCRSAEKSVVTPVGTFENCLVFTVDSDDEGRTVTTISPGVGIVEQTIDGEGQRVVLTSYKVNGGDGLIPFAVGNRWNYHVEVEGYRADDEQYMEVIGTAEDKVTMSVGCFVRIAYDKETWHGNTLAARQGYCKQDPDKPKNDLLVDVEQYLVGAEKTAKTRREKVHTEVANKVMRRIFATDDDFNPDYTEKGCWNFFEPLTVLRKDEKLLLVERDGTFSFEWKDWQRKDGKNYIEMFAVGCNFLYEIVNFALGALWSDKWVPGYEEERTFKQYDMDVSGRIRVLEDEAVETPVGSFTACRHLVADMQGGYGYWSGHTEFWYAEGVGLVKFLRTITECGEPWRNAVWLLTEYRGTGEGFFPAADGFFRKYEAQGLENGYHGSVEYTYLEDEEGLTIYKAAFGTQDRAEYEKVK